MTSPLDPFPRAISAAEEKAAREAAARAVMAALSALPHHGSLPGRDGMSCSVWLDPRSAALAAALCPDVPDGNPVLRAILTESGLFVWLGACLRHAEFERTMGMDGMRLQLGYSSVLVHQDVLALESAPWASEDYFDLDTEGRCAAVSVYLAAQARIAAIYPAGFTLGWYC